MDVQKIAKHVLLFFVFIFLVAILFLGIQSFTNNVEGISPLKSRSTAVFQGSLTSPVDAASTSDHVSQPVIKEVLTPEKVQAQVLQVPALAALSVAVSGGQPKVLFERNGDKKLPIASLTKLMTALVVLEHDDLSQQVAISDKAMLQEGVQGVLKAGQVLTVKDLLYISLMESSNRAAYALAEVTGVDKFIAMMNEKAQNMGLANTYFTDTTGLDAGSYSTADDLAKLTQYLFENYPLFKEIISLKKYDLYMPDGAFHHTLANTNELLGTDGIIGGKTGYTDIAKGCVMVIRAVLGQEGYTINIILGSDDRFKEMQTMIDKLNSKN